MTHKDIRRMAREAEIHADKICRTAREDEDLNWQWLRDEHLARLVAAAEREACATIADKIPAPCSYTKLIIAEAIRARGEGSKT